MHAYLIEAIDAQAGLLRRATRTSTKDRRHDD
jgi:hypothetical protein